MITNYNKATTINNPATVIMSFTGVTRLINGSAANRYTGSKGYLVNPRGQLKTKSRQMSEDEPYKLGVHSKKKARRTNPGEEGDQAIKADTNVRKKTYSVQKKLVRNRLLAFIRSQSGIKQLYFWTITFPQGTTDNTAYKAFNVWLTTLRTEKKLRSYLWVAERQQNNTIHFHIAIPHKMPVFRSNRAMQVTLSNLVRSGELDWSQTECKKYNGVDIAKNRKTKAVTNFAVKKGKRALTTYLTKYVTKNDGSFTHLAWHNSREFSNLFTSKFLTIDEAMNLDLYLYVAENPVLITEHFEFYAWIGEPPDSLMSDLIRINETVLRHHNRFYSSTGVK